MAPAIDNTTAKSLRVALPAPHLGVLLGLNRGARDELVSQVEDRLSAVSRPLLGVSCRINAIGSTAMFVSARVARVAPGVRFDHSQWSYWGDSDDAFIIRGDRGARLPEGAAAVPLLQVTEAAKRLMIDASRNASSQTMVKLATRLGRSLPVIHWAAWTAPLGMSEEDYAHAVLAEGVNLLEPLTPPGPLLSAPVSEIAL